jgi:ABC-2 type transport system permease protein
MDGRHSHYDLNGAAPTLTWHGSSVYTQVTVLTRRAVLDFLSDPRAVVTGLAQPVIWLFLLTSLFSKFGRPPGFPPRVSYFNYVLPAVLVETALQASLQTGTGLIEELRNGIVPRLRSLPVLPSSLLTARSITGLMRTAVQVLITMVLAQLTHGNFSRGGLAGLTVSFGLTLLIGWSLGWVFLAISAWVRRADTVQNLGFMVLFLLMFASSAYVPVRDLPTGLSVVARVNPLTYAINATRTILLQTPGGAGAIQSAILFSLVIGAAGTFAAVLLFRRPLEVTRR